MVENSNSARRGLCCCDPLAYMGDQVFGESSVYLEPKRVLQEEKTQGGSVKISPGAKTAADFYLFLVACPKPYSEYLFRLA